MPVYMVERILPGATVESLEALRTASQRACAASTQTGKPVRYVRSTFTPGESRCRCLFEAPNVDLVRGVNEAAQLPYSRIILALDLESSPGPPAPTVHTTEGSVT